ncbi:ASNSD1 upstream open reading frame protein-like [Physella acuta]|uniref:ASNSD1 upstream open reading frame protein-like n=1 Tax=Physella acuta TaxID=109671 RepID=UPI0027DC327D|nr:ASNSD1 upstream open reading frame protein-like [Physella acuta]
MMNNQKVLEIESEISLHKVLQSELSQLKANAKVYQKQHNSDIYFLSSVDHEMAESRSKLDYLVAEKLRLETKKISTT